MLWYLTFDLNYFTAVDVVCKSSCVRIRSATTGISRQYCSTVVAFDVLAHLLLVFYVPITNSLKMEFPNLPQIIEGGRVFEYPHSSPTGSYPIILNRYSLYFLFFMFSTDVFHELSAHSWLSNVNNILYHHLMNLLGRVANLSYSKELDPILQSATSRE